MSFERSVERVLRVEGGYVNNPNDRGGETNFGITKATALNNKDLWKAYNFNGNMKEFPKELAKAIYKREYWDKIHGDTLDQYSPLLSDHMFDLAVNSGTKQPVRDLQTLLNLLNRNEKDYGDIVVDGLMGKGTLSALNSYVAKRGDNGLYKLIITLVSMQASRYLKLSLSNPSQEAFTNGWLDRTYAKLTNYINYISTNS